MLALDMLNTGERVELRPDRDDGGCSARELDRAAHALRDTRTGNDYPVEPRLLDFAYLIERHFDVQAPAGGLLLPHAGRQGEFESWQGAGDRSRGSGRRRRQGRSLRARLRLRGRRGSIRRAGSSTWTRASRSYFWVQTSWNRIAPVFARDAAAADCEAVRRGERPPARWAPPGDDVELARAALASHGKAPALATHADSSDENDEEEGAPRTSPRPSP